jgi:antitoxin (DNA-binding transcriptional repressor) of toxin-antitoxin stability system
MRVVGVKQLKARLSEYLRDVKRGEVFLVTDRDQVVAELRPARSGARPIEDDLERALEALEETAQITPARMAKRDWSWHPRGAGLAPGTSAKLLDSIRSERVERAQ